MAKIQTAMILAAGLGTRMHPLSQTIPKPLIPVFGKPLLDHAIDALSTGTGVKKIIVNMHYLADQIEAHLKSKSGKNLPQIILSDEREQLLNSGGGIVNALDHLGKAPFFLLNADTFWLEGVSPNLRRLVQAFDEKKMDILLMLADATRAVGYEGRGDFTMDGEGRLKRRAEQRVAPFAYAGAAIIDPEIFKNAPKGPFSLNLSFDEAIENERLYGMGMEGLWLHVGTPAAIIEAEQAIAKSAA